MKSETLTKANDLTEKIKNLNAHLVRAKGEKDNSYEGENARLRAENNYNSDSFGLRNDCLPMGVSEFMELYISRVEKKIKQLEKEFENL